MDTKISVITVTLNAAATLEKAIVSVIGQSYANVEYIIIDGGSSDDTKEIIKKYQPSLGYYHSEKDNGIYDAMNKGINACTGDWIIFLGADDVFYDDNVIGKIVNYFKVAEYDLAYGNVAFKSNGKIVGSGKNYHQLIAGNIVHQAIFYKKKIFDEIPAFNIRYKILADYDLNLRIFRNPSLKKLYIPEVITIFNDKGVSNVTIDELFFKEQLSHFINDQKMPSDSPLLQQYYFYYGFANIFRNNWSTGARNVLQALTKGRKKIYFFLMTGKLLLYKIGIGKKMKVCENPDDNIDQT